MATATPPPLPEMIQNDLSLPVQAAFADAAPPALMPPPLPPPESQNYFLRHWRGELSLPVSYWVNGVVLGIAAGIAIALLSALIYRGDEGRPLLWLSSLVATWLSIILLVAWQSVGGWRSAVRYRRSGKFFWGTAAQAMIVLGVLQAGYRFVMVGAPQIAGMYEIAAGDTRVGPHQFHILANGRVLEFSGGITFGVAQEMQGFLAAMENVERVRLNSIGGRILEAQKMSDLIKARGLSTVVFNQCLSACTIVFLGGKERWLAQNGRLGFHQPAFRGMSETERRLTIALEEERLQKFGLSRAFAERANSAAPASMWIPEKDELLREHVITRILTLTPNPAKAKPPAAAFTPPPVATEVNAAAAASRIPTDASASKPASDFSDQPRAIIPPDVIKRLTAPKPRPLPSVVTGTK